MAESERPRAHYVAFGREVWSGDGPYDNVWVSIWAREFEPTDDEIASMRRIFSEAVSEIEKIFEEKGPKK